MYTSSIHQTMIHQQSRVYIIGPRVVHLLLRWTGRVWALYLFIYLKLKQHPCHVRTGEIHEMKPNKTGETVIHLEDEGYTVYTRYSSIQRYIYPHVVTEPQCAIQRYSTIQRYIYTTRYNVSDVTCITTPQFLMRASRISGASASSRTWSQSPLPLARQG